ncbi:lysozyme family protein [Streptococcus sp. DD13]|uniref:lysozyme family protein n=1 Tax=Streptococcus sp. DD13 TaxID=1777881 RepID=UPI000796945B|nr:lysozyme family protein [Streptococcus sp. DD13]KXT78813.1 vaccine antigen A-like protein [Streptococcus sp. DD13]
MMKKLIKIVALLCFFFFCYHIFKIHQDVRQVYTYQSLVKQILAENDSSENEELVLAMIYTETKGKSADVMQSSESISGISNSINDSEESIRKGIEYLNQNLEYANEKGVDKWTAIQAYNFGQGYIDYVARHGKKHTTELAREYSKTVVAPSLGNKNGQTYMNYHPIALLNGGKLYVNGGNIYYAQLVNFNLQLIKLMQVI